MAGASAWEQYCRMAEVKPAIQADLRRVLEGGTKVVLLLDDSGSMATPVRQPGDNPFLPCATTRWTNLLTDVYEVLTLVTSLDPHGVDIHFMNRQGMWEVTRPEQVAQLFSAPPSGDTPMLKSLRVIIQQYRALQSKVLIVMITDGEPTDGSYDQLFRLLKNELPSNFYFSFTECNDNEEEMNYLSGWDTQLPRFHNQEDYGEELKLVRQVQGPNTQFTRANYIQMMILSPIFPQYAIDIRTAGGRWRPANGMVASNANVYQNRTVMAPMASVTPPPPVMMQAPALGVPAAVAAPPPPPLQPASAWDVYCRQAEVRPDIQADLRSVLESGTKIVLLLDDSGSMAASVRPLAGVMTTGPPVTRWSELMTDVSEILQLVTTLSPDGIDMHFMNREGMMGVRDVSQVASLFAKGPRGGTPMIGMLRTAYERYRALACNVLLILVTDGEPSDGSYSQLFACLQQMPRNFYVSFVECNDNEEEMAYLTSWDTRLARFHNQEDYGEELRLVRQVNGPNAKFTRANYVQMIVLSPFFPKYAIDMRRNAGILGPGACCVVS